jgi:hypothetical protein
MEFDAATAKIIKNDEIVIETPREFCFECEIEFSST